MDQLRYFILLLLIASCSHLQLDLEKVQSWSSEAGQRETHQSPYISMFKKGKKTLLYLAARHSNHLESPTFKTIRYVLKNMPPQFVILEGFPNNNEISPARYLRHAKKCQKFKFSACGGEPAYTALLAKDKDIPFAGGEPSNEQLSYEIQALGYAKVDLASFYLLRHIPQLRREKKLKNKNFSDQASTLLKRFASELKLGVEVDFQSFEKWYLRHRSDNVHYLNIEPHAIAPINSQASTYFQKMSAQIGIIREKFINGVINNALKKHDKVLVVYGAGHLVMSRKVYEDFFGASEDKKVF